MHSAAHLVQVAASSPLLSPWSQHVPGSRICDPSLVHSQGVGQTNIHGELNTFSSFSWCSNHFPFKELRIFQNTHIHSIWLSSHIIVLEKRLYFPETGFLISISFPTSLHTPSSLQIISPCLQVYFQSNSGKGVWRTHFDLL